MPDTRGGSPAHQLREAHPYVILSKMYAVVPIVLGMTFSVSEIPFMLTLSGMPSLRAGTLLVAVDRMLPVAVKISPLPALLKTMVYP